VHAAHTDAGILGFRNRFAPMTRHAQPKAVLASGSLFDFEADLVFPRRFDVQGKVHRNPVQRVAAVEQIQHCTISPFSTRNRSGFVATDPSGRRTVLVSKPGVTAEGEHALLVAGETIETVQRSLSEHAGRWFRPRPADPND
jgi:hypothetical protein